MSSLDRVAAPCRANASSATLFPAPIPPVSATERGRLLLLVRGVGGCCGFFPGRCGFFLDRRGILRRLELGGRRRRGGVGEDVFREIQMRRALERRLVFGPALGIDALERQGKPAPLRVDLEDQDGNGLPLRGHLARWRPPAPRSTSGVFAKHVAMVSSVTEGAVTVPGSVR